jgi:uncharacterized repeat protein (TIGR03803 family)
VRIAPICLVLAMTGCAGPVSGLFQPPSQIALKEVNEASSGHFSVFFAFDGNDGFTPAGGLVDSHGALYGVTVYGSPKRCYDCGEVYKLPLSGGEKTVHAFGVSFPDGHWPEGRPVFVDGAIYGTTPYGGGNYCNGSCGTVYKIAPGGRYRVLHTFPYVDDEYSLPSGPWAGLTHSGAELYGTTLSGPTPCGDNCGTIFRITKTGKLTTLHTFTSADGYNPFGPLVDVNGTLYGAASAGGPYQGGTIFSMDPQGRFAIVFAFSGSSGAYPEAGLINVNGTLYGTTYTGTVFKVTTAGQFSVLCTVGRMPDGELTYAKGALYGTTYYGGSAGFGSVFRVTLDGTEQIVYSFGGGSDGEYPSGTMAFVGDALYGESETQAGSGLGPGQIFKIQL